MDAKKFSRLLFFSLFLLASTIVPNISSSAKGIYIKDLTEQTKPFNVTPRLSLWGWGGSFALGESEFSIPIYSNMTQNLYLITESNIANRIHGWMAGGGFGYRKIIKGSIWGIYGLLDYDVSPECKGFWVVNPGIEMLGEVLDLNLNGYISLNDEKKIGNPVLGSATGIETFHRFTGHEELDRQFQRIEESASGFDFEVGKKIPHFEQAEIYIGGYHADTKLSGTMNGIEGKLTYECNKYITLEFEDHYDNKFHNLALLGIRFTAGGYSDQEKRIYGIATRLNEPIEHDLAIGSGATVTPIVSEMTTTAFPQDIIINDNIWFFKPLPVTGIVGDIGGLQGDGTFENPFVGFTPANVAAVNPTIRGVNLNPSLYFAPGNYNFDGFNTRGIERRYALPNGWGMFGRSSNYASAANGSERPSFSGGLDLYYPIGFGNQLTSIDSLQIINTAGSDANLNNSTIYIRNAMNIAIRNTNVENNVATNDFGAGIYAENSKISFGAINGINFGSNSIMGSGSGPKNRYGIFATDSQINFDGGINTITTSGNTLDVAINAVNTSIINFNSGFNSLNSTDGKSIVLNFSSLNFINGVNSITSQNDGISATASTINVAGGDNHFTSPNSSGISASASSIIINNGSNQINANLPLNLDNSTALLHGGNNNFVSNGPIGIDLNASTISFGPDTISNINAHSEGIHAASSSSITFGGGQNEITVNNINNGVNSTGIFLQNSSLAFSGGNNTITANVGTNAIAKGIDHSGSGITFQSSTNNIIVNGQTGSTLYGIYSDTSTTSFSSGTNIITVTGNSSTNAFGIYAIDFSTLAFSTTSPKTQINVSNAGSSRTGIFGNLSTLIPFDPSLSLVQNFVNIPTLSGIGGEKIRWDGSIVSW